MAWGAEGNDSLLMGKLLDAILTAIERQLEHQLPGGKFWNPSPELQSAAALCECNNISWERQFAVMKSYQYKAPAMRMTRIEGKQLFKANKCKKAY